MSTKQEHFYHLSALEVLEKFKTHKKGITENEADKRLRHFGLNKLPEEKKQSVFVLFISQFHSILIYILLVAAVINFILVSQEEGGAIWSIQKQIDTYIILLAVFINVIVGFIQENKAQKSLSALKKVITYNARVVRAGQEKVVKAEEVVPGDIIIITAGNKIPADARLFEVNNLEVNESALTGESVPIKKVIAKQENDITIGDQINMVFTGTVVAKGEGRAVVVKTGQNTQIGQIAQLIKETKDEATPLQKKLNVFAKNVGIIVLIISGVLVLFGYLQGDPFKQIFTVAVAVAVSALPEGLAVAVTVILALGMQRTLKRKALVRKLVAAETLGSTTVICTDKTGTLTEGKMQVTDLVTWDHDFAIKNFLKREFLEKESEEILFALHAGLLCNDAKIDNIDDEIDEWSISGNLTEQALLIAAIDAGLDYKHEIKSYPRLDTIAFDSTIKYMATLNELDDKQNIVYFKGAPEIVMSRSQHLRIGYNEEPLTEDKRKKFQHKFITLSNKGLRVLAIAYRKVPKAEDNLKKVDLNNLVFIGYIGIKDPLRETSFETVRLCQKAGVKVVMITGDHRLTAQVIGKELGLPCGENNILEGSDLDKMNHTDLIKKVADTFIYARVSPEHKLRIIQAWQAKGEVVAMTGDGINDSPALKAADIGVALGSGTQVAKETADIVILDDNFGSIVAAVEEGRGIFDNIKKTVLYLISDSFSEVILVIGTMLMGMPLPLSAAQILWINLVNDTLPNLALTQEPKEKQIMDEPPRGHKAKILDGQIKLLITLISFLSGGAGLLLFYIYSHLTKDFALSSSMVFALLGFDSLVYVFSLRSFRSSILKTNFFSNIYLIFAVIISLVLLVMVFYIPYFQDLINTEPLRLFDWMIISIIALTEVFFIELTKYFYLKKSQA